MVQGVAFAFLGCQALITLALVSHFQHDDHLIFLNAMAHVETSIYPFQVALQDICAMLHEVIQSHVLPFENLIMQSYVQLQYSLKDQLHKNEFTSLFIDVRLDVVRTCFCSCASLVLGAWLLVRPSNLHFVYPLPLFY